MAQTVLITLTLAGSDTGPFNLYSNIDGFTLAFETNVAKGDLEAGYVSFLVPDSATTIRVKSDNPVCDSYVDIVITTTTTTSTSSTTTSTSSTTTTTTTAPPTTTTTTTLNETIVNIENNITGGEVISLDSLSVSGGFTFTPTSGSFPLAQGQNLTGKINGQGTFDLTVGISVGVPPGADKITVTDSTGTPTCENITAGGAYAFLNQVCNNSTTVFINAQDGAC